MVRKRCICTFDIARVTEPNVQLEADPKLEIEIKLNLNLQLNFKLKTLTPDSTVRGPAY